MATKEQLLERLARICYHDVDPITLQEWRELDVAQLRTVVALLDEDVVDAMYPDDRKRHCFLLDVMYAYLKTNLRTPVEIMAHRRLTRREIQNLLSAMKAYFPGRTMEVVRTERALREIHQVAQRVMDQPPRELNRQVRWWFRPPPPGDAAPVGPWRRLQGVQAEIDRDPSRLF